MPIRVVNPFRDPTSQLRSDVNPFMLRMREAMDSGSLPLLYGPGLKPWAKNWRSWFASETQQSPKELIVEIGCHKGDVLKEMALQHPDKAFIGLDITFKRVVSTAEKAVQFQLNNVLSILCNGQALEQVFAPSEVDGFVIFFPDPWVRKKRQQKNRLINSEFFKSLSQALRPGGFIWLKTDHQPYFESICQLAEAWQMQVSSDHEGLPKQTYTSRFEQFFQNSGEATFSRCWVKPESPLISDS